MIQLVATEGMALRRSHLASAPTEFYGRRDGRYGSRYRHAAAETMSATIKTYERLAHGDTGQYIANGVPISQYSTLPDEPHPFSFPPICMIPLSRRYPTLQLAYPHRATYGCRFLSPRATFQVSKRRGDRYQVGVFGRISLSATARDLIARLVSEI